MPLRRTPRMRARGNAGSLSGPHPPPPSQHAGRPNVIMPTIELDSAALFVLASDPMLQEMVALFVDEMPERIGRFRDYFDGGDWEGLRDRASGKGFRRQLRLRPADAVRRPARARRLAGPRSKKWPTRWTPS